MGKGLFCHPDYLSCTAQDTHEGGHWTCKLSFDFHARAIACHVCERIPTHSCTKFKNGGKRNQNSFYLDHVLLSSEKLYTFRLKFIWDLLSLQHSIYEYRRQLPRFKDTVQSCLQKIFSIVLVVFCFGLVWSGFFFVHLTQAKVIGKRGPQLRPCLHLIGWDGLENHEIYAAVFLKLKMLSGRPYLCLACFNSFFLLIVLPHLSLTSHVWVPSRAHSTSIIVGITGMW